ncbi:outer membrane beta-barrel protein [bacterium]|nr:outer membrane beta-barrel protein [bacterium]
MGRSDGDQEPDPGSTSPARIMRDSTPCPLLRWLAAAALLVAADPAAALDRGGLADISLGFKGGVGLTQHQGTEPREFDYTVGSSMRRGLAGGVFLTLPITRRFALQQEVLYVQKGSRQDIGVDIFEIPTVLDVTYDMDYIEIPLMMRYHWLTGRGLNVYTLGGFGFALKVHDRYVLSGEVSDGDESIPLRADADMSEVDLFDFFFTYGAGVEVPLGGQRLLLEYRFDLSLQQLPLPTYATIPIGDDETVVENDPVPLRNQAHMLMLGIRF